MRVIANQNETLDAICHRVYGRTAGVVEQALLDNPGLAELGAVLPMGTPVELRDDPPQPKKNLINLWD